MADVKYDYTARNLLAGRPLTEREPIIAPKPEIALEDFLRIYFAGVASEIETRLNRETRH